MLRVTRTAKALYLVYQLATVLSAAAAILCCDLIILMMIIPGWLKTEQIMRSLWAALLFGSAHSLAREVVCHYRNII